MNKEKNGSILPIMAMDSISDAGPDALKITGLVKSGGTVTGYQLSIRKKRLWRNRIKGIRC